MKLSTGFMNFLRNRITFRFEVSTRVRGNHLTEPRRNATQRNATQRNKHCNGIQM